MICVRTHTENARGTGTNSPVTSIGDGIRSDESASESNDEIACADSVLREIDEMNKFKEGDLDGKDANNYKDADNI